MFSETGKFNKFLLPVGIFLLAFFIIFPFDAKAQQAIPTTFQKPANGTLSSDDWNYLLGYSTTTLSVYSVAGANGAFVNTKFPAFMSGPLGINTVPEGARLRVMGVGGDTKLMSLLNSAGTELFTVLNSSGNVGIGISAPLANLDIKTSAGFTRGLKIGPQNTTNGDGSYIEFNTSSVDGHGAQIGGLRTAESGGANALVIRTGNNVQVERLRVTNSGYIGIATSSPATQLYIDGTGIARNNTMTFGNNYDLVNKGYVDATIGSSIATATSSITLWGGSTAGKIWSLNGANNVGIGTTDPTTKLDIAGDVNLNNQAVTTAGSLNRGYYVYRSGTTAYGLKLQYTGGEYGPMIFGPNQANRFISFGKAGAALEDDDMVEQMRLDLDTGNLGIGTTNPGSRLHVSGDISVNGGNRLRWYPDNYHSLRYAQVAYGDDYVGEAMQAYGGLYVFTNTDNSASSTNAKFVIKQNGNVGIGNANPGSRLEVVDSKTHISGDLAGTDGILRLYNNYNVDVAEKGSVITFEDNYLGTNRTTRAAIKGGTATSGNTADGFLAFYTDASGANSMQERMRINHIGNVGIATSTPPTQFYINGTGIGRNNTMTFSNSYDLINKGYADSLVSSAIATATSSITLWGGSIAGNIWSLNGANNVGVGTTNPSAKLEIVNGKLQVNSGGALGFVGAGTANLYASGGSSLYFYDSTFRAAIKGVPGTSLAFETNDVEKMRLTASGNLGIGTTTPAQKLSVGTTASDYIQSYGGFIGHPNANIGGTGDAAFFPEGIYSSKMNWLYGGINMNNGALSGAGTGTFSGNVSMGTTTLLTQLYIAGTGIARNNTMSFGNDYDLINKGYADALVGSSIAAATSTITLWGGTTAGEIWSLNGANNVGVGTTDPGYKLDVVGDINSSAEVRSLTGKFNSIYNRATGNQLISFNASDNVSIGTTTATSKLFVDGTMNVTGNTVFSGNTNSFYQVNSPFSTLSVGRGSTQRFAMTVDDMTGTMTSYQQDEVAGDHSWVFNIVSPTTGAQNYYFRNNGTNLLTLTKNGNIGVSTTTPSTQLYINGTGIARNNTMSFGNNYDLINKGYVDSAINSGIAAATSTITLWGGSTTGNIWSLNNGNNVGIGTTAPQAKIQIFSGEVGGGNPQEVARFEGDWGSIGSGPLLRFTNQHNSGTVPNTGEYNLAGIQGRDFNGNWGGGLSFMTPNAGTAGGSALVDRMVIREGGNIGIGTTAPAVPLNIVGNTRIDSGVFSLYYPGTARTVAEIQSIGAGASADDGMLKLYRDGVVTAQLTSDPAGGHNFVRYSNFGISTTTPPTQLYIDGTGIARNNTMSFSNNYDLINKGYADSLVSSAIATATSSITLWGGTTGGSIWNLNSGNVSIGTTTASAFKLNVVGNIQTNNLTFANPGFGVDTRITFSKLTDAAWLSVNEVSGDTTEYSFNMSDNPDQPGDKFYWKMTDWQGTGGAWTPLQFAGLNAQIAAANINAFGNYNVYGPWYSSDGNPNTIYSSKTGTINLTPNISGYTGTTGVYWFKIDGTGSPNTFSWGRGSTGSVAVATGVAITGGAQAIENGILVTFSATTGGALNDLWQFRVNAGGNLRVANGTALLPSLSFTGDTNTGVYLNGVDQLGFSTAGVNRVTVNSTGNVGIGTTNPLSRFTVQTTGLTSDIPLVIGQPLNVNAYTGLGFQGYTAGGAAIKSAILHERTSTYGTGKLHFALDGTLDNSNVDNNDIKVTIQNDSSFGIASTSPSTQLVIAGTGIARNNTLSFSNNYDLINKAYADSLVSSAIATATSSITFWGGSTAGNIWSLNSGNVGVGTTTPIDKLHVVGNIRHTGALISQGANYGHPWMAFDQDVNGNSLILGSGGFTAIGAGESASVMRAQFPVNQETLVLSSDNDIRFMTNSQNGWASTTAALAILANGNVGVGTVNPEAKLEVIGRLNIGDFTNNTVGNLQVKGNGADNGITVWNEGGAVTFRMWLDEANNTGFITRGVASTTGLALNSSGYIGIASSSPATQLVVAGTGIARNTTMSFANAYDLVNKGYADALVSSAIATATSSITLWGGTTGGNIWNLNNGNNVGIGTTAPKNKLHLSGSVSSNTIPALATAGDSTSFVVSNTDINYGILMGVLATGKGWIQSQRTTGAATAYDLLLQPNGGNVGIGTAAPGSILEVRSSTNARLTINRAGSWATSPGDIKFSTNDAGTDYWTLGMQSNSTNNFYLNKNSSNYLTILDSGGNVGIGTTNPIQKLDVAGVVKSNGFTNLGISQTVKGLTWSRIVDLNNTGVLGTSFIINISGTRNNVVWNSTWQVTTSHSGQGFLTLLSSTGYTQARLRLVVDSNGAGYLEFYDQGTGAVLGTDQTISVSLNNYLGTSVVLTSFQDGTDTTGYAVLTEATSISGGLISQGGALIAGSVGIATTTPSTQLVVAGTGIARNTTMSFANNYDLINKGYADSLVSSAIATATSSITLWGGTTGGKIWSLNNGNNVGIGTTNPLSKLQIGASDGTDAMDTPARLRILSATDQSQTPEVLLRLIRKHASGLYYPGSVDFKVYSWGTSGSPYYPRTAMTIALKGDVGSHNDSANVDVMTFLSSGNVGIGTSTPTEKLEVNGKLKIGNNTVSGENVTFDGSTSSGMRVTNSSGYISITPLNSSWAHIYTDRSNFIFDKPVYSIVGKFSAYNTSNLELQTAGITRMTLNATTGYAGIATTTPPTQLYINGTGIGRNNTMSFGNDYDLINKGYLDSAMSGTDAFWTGVAGGDIRNSNTGNVGIGAAATAGVKLNVGGSVAATGMSLSGALTMTGTGAAANITGVNKLTAYTIDPLYHINGVNYSTYAPSMVGGVKEEYVGRIMIDKAKIVYKNHNEVKEYEAVIDFSNQKEGSDLWVWRKVVDFSKENVNVSIVPYGDFASVYYLIEGNKLIFRSDKAIEVSYRLNASRFDWKKWPTIPVDQTERGWDIE